jgi:type 1 fimbria pilin
MKSKYVVFAVTLLLALSSTPAMAAANGNFLKANTADTHGPRIAAFTWTTINPDASLAQALKTGTVQFAEWYLSRQPQESSQKP